MIKEKAKELLISLKNGKGSPTLFGSSYYDEETRKIIEVLTNECKSTVTNSKGQVKRYESDLEINTVREIVKQLLSDKNSIKGSLARDLTTQDGIVGLTKDVKVEKKINEKGLPYLDIKKPFPDDFEQILTGAYNRDELIKKVIKPYVSRLCKQTPSLNKKHLFSRLFSPSARKEISDEELLKRYSSYLEKNTDLDEEKIDNMSKYFIYHVLGNNKIMQDLVNDELNGNSLVILGEKQKMGYQGMLQNMSNNVLDMVTIVKNPNDKLVEVEKIYENLTGQLEALSTEFSQEPSKIEEQIKTINRTINRDKQGYYSETGYRNVNVGFRNKESGLLEREHVPSAMKLYSQAIGDLLEKSDTMSEAEYIKEVAKLHYRFIRIHPFPDGNGRTGRAISNALLTKKGLCAVFDKTMKNEYIRQMNGVRAKNSDEKTYNTGLYTDRTICDKIEDENVYKLEEYIGIQLLNKPELYADRDITAELKPGPKLDQDSLSR